MYYHIDKKLNKKQFFLKTIIVNILIIFLFLGCASTKNLKVKEKKQNTVSSINLVFAGDIMAHTPNFLMADFNKIWESVTDDIIKNDFAFANIEAPVDDTKDFSNYPNFNMKETYASAFINAGFNVFSLINNHTNDQELSGMMQTLKWAEKTSEESKNSDRKIYFSGLKESEESNFSYCVIEKNGIKILFLAITEILNQPSYNKYMNFVRPTKKSRQKFIQFLTNIQKNNPHDLIVLSVHSDDPEYIQKVSDSRKSFFYELADLGVDIIWANHPHVVREHDVIINKKDGKIKNIIMYGNGNTISAQRTKPRFDNPAFARDDTGDGKMVFVTIKKEANITSISKINTKYITTYITPKYEFVIKPLNDSFISWLKINHPEWASYIKNRKNITENIKENLIWQ